MSCNSSQLLLNDLRRLLPDNHRHGRSVRPKIRRTYRQIYSIISPQLDRVTVSRPHRRLSVPLLHTRPASHRPPRYPLSTASGKLTLSDMRSRRSFAPISRSLSRPRVSMSKMYRRKGYSKPRGSREKRPGERLHLRLERKVGGGRLLVA